MNYGGEKEEEIYSSDLEIIFLKSRFPKIARNNQQKKMRKQLKMESIRVSEMKKKIMEGK